MKAVSVTGLLCLGAVATALGYLTVTLVFGHRVAIKAFHVVMMSSEDYAPLQEKVAEISKKMRLAPPKVGLIDDLRPNAFTLGFGRKTAIVFSLGILKILDNDELAAVASHELAHVKSKDYLFRSLSYSLNILSFFNPLSYFSASEAQKERELLADERGSDLLREPKLMAHVLAKIDKVLQAFPKESFSAKLSSSLFLVSPLSRRSEILASHPQIAHRVRNINAVTQFAPKPRHKTATLLLLSILVLTAVASGYAMVQVQNSFLPTAKGSLVHDPGAGELSLSESFGFQNCTQFQMEIGPQNPFSLSPLPGYSNFSTGSQMLVIKWTSTSTS
jgi:heat shock protein HtpX